MDIHQQRPVCGQSNYFNKTDAINILYYTAFYGNLGKSFTPFAGNNVGYLRDTSFRRMIDQTIAIDINIKLPTVTDRNKSCMKLVQCQQGLSGSNNIQLTLQNQQRCENTLRQAYISKTLTNRSYALLTDGTF
jgi:hypothetical protein